MPDKQLQTTNDRLDAIVRNADENGGPPLPKRNPAVLTRAQGVSVLTTDNKYFGATTSHPPAGYRNVPHSNSSDLNDSEKRRALSAARPR